MKNSHGVLPTRIMEMVGGREDGEHEIISRAVYRWV